MRERADPRPPLRRLPDVGVAIRSLSTVLVANRGEIAVRILRTLNRLGIRSVAVYSDADAGARHVAEADVAVHLGPTPAALSYLSIERVLDAARRTGAQAIHPGYGFLSENAAFACACADAGVVFIGPPAAAIETMGDKIAAKRTVEAAGVPVVPGVHAPGMDDEALIAAAGEVGFPLMVKAAAGGGGKGMRVVAHPDALPDAITAARREAHGAFGNEELLLERFITTPRHIEVQVFADSHGDVVYLGERECSLQRRHQKIVEECPSPLLEKGMRERMGSSAVEAARACGYVGAGTVEFIVSGDATDAFFFLEMNTRLQVEHPVTELVYGVDLVEWQVHVAAGGTLPLRQDQLHPRGHAMEARVYAEDPARGFLPTGGTVLAERAPNGDVRLDSGLRPGVAVATEYDPLLAKVIVHAEDRLTALGRLERAVRGYGLLGVRTNLHFLAALLGHPDVVAGHLDTGLVERHVDDLVRRDVPEAVLAAAALVHVAEAEPSSTGAVDPFELPGGWRLGEDAWTTFRFRPPGEKPRDVRVRGRAAATEVQVGDGPVRRCTVDRGAVAARMTIDGVGHEVLHERDGTSVWLHAGNGVWELEETDELSAARHHDQAAPDGLLVAPMPGTVTVVAAEPGQPVSTGQTVVVIEAMKMEHPLTAPFDGTLAALHVRAGEQVAMNAALALVTPVDGA